MKKILELSKSVSKHCVGFEGNVSSKYKNGLIIKASGTRLESLTKKDLVFFDFKGNQLNNFKKRGSMELSFHTYLLSFDDINYVSHTHPSNTVKILCSELSKTFAQNRLFPDQFICVRLPRAVQYTIVFPSSYNLLILSIFSLMGLAL